MPNKLQEAYNKLDSQPMISLTVFIKISETIIPVYYTQTTKGTIASTTSINELKNSMNDQGFAFLKHCYYDGYFVEEIFINCNQIITHYKIKQEVSCD